MRALNIIIILLLCFALLAIGCVTSGPTLTPTPSVIVSPSIIPSTDPANKLYGLNFGPYIDGQSPEYGSVISESQLRGRMSIIAPHTVWIRTYSSSSGLEHAGAVGHSLGLKVAAGAWLSPDMAANEREINALINQSKAGNVDLAIIGSETLYRGDLTEDQLIDYIQRFRQAMPGVPVTTADTYGELKAHPGVVDACDVVMFNYFPYFEGIRIEDAVPAMDSVYKDMVSRSGGKQTIISETGWPSAGSTKGQAVPSQENASAYFNGITRWAAVNHTLCFYFEAFDEAWKANSEGPQGAHWGVWDKDGNIKAGMTLASG